MRISHEAPAHFPRAAAGLHHAPCTMPVPRSKTMRSAKRAMPLDHDCILMQMGRFLQSHRLMNHKCRLFSAAGSLWHAFSSQVRKKQTHRMLPAILTYKNAWVHKHTEPQAQTLACLQLPIRDQPATILPSRFRHFSAPKGHPQILDL